MTSILRNSFLTAQLPNLAFKRFRGKINIQRPKQPHFHRALILAMTKPIYPKKERVIPCPLDESKFKKKAVEVNPYEVILAKEARNWFDQSKMVGIVHINPINGEEFFKAAVALHKQGMKIKKYGNSLLKLAVQDTKYECILELNQNKFFSTGFIFCTEHNKVNTMLKVLKKIPQMTLLCGIAEGQLLSKNEFIAYGNMPDIQIVRSQFVNVLNLAGSQLVQNLQSHQTNLVNILDAHVRENTKSDAKEVKNENSESTES
ncbi:large ribosomal subunit protein uL10m [Chironomus tepperi]|uniref:large ribosomal subunit protein uL10m n=1 Tax=Chironomus tepperi TaxID=113505 RepID=UPI00391F0134